jgi:hypothetical protein
MMENRVVVKQAHGGWLVQSPDEQTVVVLKTDAVKLGRKAAKAIPGRTLLIVLKQDGSVESATEHGADRAPPTYFSIGTNPA